MKKIVKLLTFVWSFISFLIQTAIEDMFPNNKKNKIPYDINLIFILPPTY
jgi:hypothetical protein